MAQDSTEQIIEDDPIEVRRAKREALMASGKDPYGQAFAYSHHIADLDEHYKDLADGENTEDRVAVAGRIMAKRVQGKIIFFELLDSTGRIQLFCRINALGEDVFAEMKDLDMGDWIGVSGLMMRTRRGQLSVAVDSFELLSKSLRPLPEKFHGLSDKELRYRQRYVDLIVNDDVRSAFEKRFKIISAFRRYMEGDGYYEVETPILQTIQGGATAKPFITHFNVLDQECYLRIATELHLKRLLVGGFERVFEIGRIFRNEGMDPTHNPEFTTMEAYRAFSDLEGMKELAEGVIKAANAVVNDSEQIEYQGMTIDLSGSWPSVPMTKIVSDALGEEVSLDTPVEHLTELAKKNGIEVKPEWTAGKLIAELYDEIGEPTIVNPTFVCDYPVEVSPLAKRFEDDPRLTHRFELVIAGHEYANAFSELNDPVDQAQRFQAQMEEKASGDDEAMEYDTDYVRALEYGMPPAGGIGIGIDRVVMLLTNQASIRDVLLFPHMRPEAK
ncbi:MAG: lysine--tRNA ligase [Eggerthellaceae bacterium]